MPSKASMLVLIARAARSVAAATGRFARVAEQAALPPKAEATAAASHAPDRVGAGDMLLHRSAAGSCLPAMAATSPAMDAPNHRVDGLIVAGIPLTGKSDSSLTPTSSPPSRSRSILSSFTMHRSAAGSSPPAMAAMKDVRMPKMDEFVAQEKDLESDEALWALYKRWCKAFNQKRDHVEMLRRFNKFKEAALLVHRTNNANLPYKLAINKFADGKLMEMCANPDRLDTTLAMKAGKSSFIVRPGGRFFRQVFADFKVVNGNLFVFKAGRGLEELPVEYEVFGGKLFVDLPEGHELVALPSYLL